MSLIYDALRKSEQQRRAGETPTLATDPGWGVRRTPSSRRAARWLWVALPVVVLAGAAGAWMLYAQRVAEPAATAPTVTEGAMPPVAQVEPAPAASAAKVAEPQPMPPPPPAGPIDGGPGMVQGEVAAGTAQSAPQSAAPAAVSAENAVVIEALTGAAPPVDGLPPTPIETAPAASAASLLATEASMAAPPPPIETTVPPPPPPPAPVEAAPAAPVDPAPRPETLAAPVVAEPALPLVYELPYAVRKNMPKLALTMHVYNDDPMRRFAIINDERRAEGDDIDGVRVVAIRRDGIELEYAGQRFLLPRAGG